MIEQEADDDQVLACALAANANANLIVSGDKHLRSLGSAIKGFGL